MTEPTDAIPVLRAHLEEIAQALEWSNGHFEALDLADGYRRGAPTVRPSRSTTLTRRAFDHAVGYLETEPPESE